MKSLENTRGVALAAFTDSFGSGLVSALSVLYFALLTNLPLAEIGLATATGALIALPLGVMGGWICDRFSSKFGMVMNNVLAAAGFCIYLIADNFALVLSAVLLVSIGDRIYWAAWTSYIHDLSAGRPYEKIFARLESIKMAAMGSGAGLAAIVLAISAATGARWLIIINVLLTVAAAVIYALAPSPVKELDLNKTADPQSAKPNVKALFTQPGFWGLMFGQFFLAPIMVLPTAVLSVHFVVTWDMNPAVAAVLFGINTGLVALAQPWLTHKIRYIRRAVLISWSSFLLAVMLILVAIMPPLSGIAAWIFVIYVGVILAVADMLYMPATNALMAEMPPRNIRGVSISIFQTSMAVGIALYPALLGLLETNALLLWAITCASILLGALAYWTATLKAPRHLRVSETRENIAL